MTIHPLALNMDFKHSLSVQVISLAFYVYPHSRTFLLFFVWNEGFSKRVD